MMLALLIYPFIEFIEVKDQLHMTAVVVNYDKCIFTIPTALVTNEDYVFNQMEKNCSEESIYGKKEKK